MEPGYGNNGKDWVIRMVTSYGRYVKPMEGRQRLNGSRSTMTSRDNWESAQDTVRPMGKLMGSTDSN